MRGANATNQRNGSISPSATHECCTRQNATVTTSASAHGTNARTPPKRRITPHAMNTAASRSPLMMRKSESWRLRRLMSVSAMVSPRRRGFALTTTVSIRRWISVNAPRPATLTTTPPTSTRQAGQIEQCASTQWNPSDALHEQRDECEQGGHGSPCRARRDAHRKEMLERLAGGVGVEKGIAEAAPDQRAAREAEMLVAGYI